MMPTKPVEVTTSEAPAVRLPGDGCTFEELSAVYTLVAQINNQTRAQRVAKRRKADRAVYQLSNLKRRNRPCQS